MYSSIQYVFNKVHFQNFAVHGEVIFDSLDIDKEIILDQTKKASFHEIDVFGGIYMIGHFGDGLTGETGPCFRHEFAGCQYGGQEESVRCIDIPTSMTREAGFESLEVDQGDETDAGWKFGPLEYSGDEFV